MPLQSREAEREKEVSTTISKEIDVRQEERIRFEMKFAAAYEQSRDAVYGYLVYMTRDASLAEDLSQEVFLRMFLHLDKFRGEAKVRTWALRIARNVFLSYAKKKRPCLLEEQEWEPEADVNRNLPEEEMLRKEEAQRVREWEEAPQRVVVWLKSSPQGLSIQENGNVKAFFYIFYPLHIWILYIAGYFCEKVL